MRAETTLRHLLFALLALVASCGGPELQARDLGGIARLHVIGDVWLSSQPGETDLAMLRVAGLRHVVDLRAPSEDRGFDERSRVESLGLEYTSLPWAAGTAPALAGMRDLRHLLKRADGPILVHGDDAQRVGAIWYAVRRLDGGASHKRALAEAHEVGLTDPLLQKLAELYVQAELVPDPTRTRAALDASVPGKE